MNEEKLNEAELSGEENGASKADTAESVPAEAGARTEKEVLREAVESEKSAKPEESEDEDNADTEAGNRAEAKKKKARTVSVWFCVRLCVVLVYLTAAISFLILTTVYSDEKRLAVGEAIAAERENNEQKNGIFKKLEMLAEIDSYIRSNYIGELDEQKIIDYIITGYLYGIGDRYIEYMSAEQYEGYVDDSFGERVGIGIRASGEEDANSIYIYHVFKDSPAEKAGILRGDIILEIDGVLVSEVGFDSAVALVSGDAGTKVLLKIKRGDETSVIEVTRGVYEIKSVEYELIEGDIGYLSISGIASATPDEFKTAIEELIEVGAKKYIFDLRNDGGGYLGAICDVLNYLLPEGPIIHWTDKDGKRESIYSDEKVLVEAPMAVLINGRTASAAELFAAALRDYNLATIIGETTYGKGSIQTFFPLSDGSVIKFSTSKYDPPYGENYDGTGVSPDIEVSLAEGESFYTVSRENDTQLKAAIEALS